MNEEERGSKLIQEEHPGERKLVCKGLKVGFEGTSRNCMYKWRDVTGKAGEVSRGQTGWVSGVRNAIATVHTEKDFPVFPRIFL